MGKKTKIVIGLDVQADGFAMSGVHLDAMMPREMSAETVYRVLRAKIDRLSQRIAVLEDQAAPSVERVGDA